MNIDDFAYRNGVSSVEVAKFINSSAKWKKKLKVSILNGYLIEEVDEDELYLDYRQSTLIKTDEITSVPEVNKDILCSNCGASIQRNTRFCGTCGATFAPNKPQNKVKSVEKDKSVEVVETPVDEKREWEKEWIETYREVFKKMPTEEELQTASPFNKLVEIEEPLADETKSKKLSKAEWLELFQVLHDRKPTFEEYQEAVKAGKLEES